MPLTSVCMCCILASKFHFFHRGLVFLLSVLFGCDVALLHLNAIYKWKCFQIYKQMANFKLQAQFFTTVTVLQFCVSKSNPFTVTPRITVKVVCKNAEVLNFLHLMVIRSLSINRFLLVTHSEYHATYLHHNLINQSILHI